jgi:hypothetical protein
MDKKGEDINAIVRKQQKTVDDRLQKELGKIEEKLNSYDKQIDLKVDNIKSGVLLNV